jgi:ubiquinone/menaquinone biosynthesis C-methylase UbiE
MSCHPSPAETYEAFMVPFRFRPWALELLDRVSLEPGMRVLDVACGTGIVARIAAERLNGTGAVTGVDMNPAMIDVAARAASEEALAIDWHVGKAESLPFADRSFDVVTIQQGLQFFPDQPSALRECLRVLVAGGTLVVGIWSTLEQQGIQQHYAEAIERVTGSASMHAPYGTVTEASLRALLVDAGFSSVAIDEVTIDLAFDEPDAFVGLMVEGTSAGVPTMHGRSDEERAALADDVAREMTSAMQASTSEGRLRTHSTAFLAVGTRPQT